MATGRACPLCPGISDINLFRYRQRIIDLDAEIPDRAFDFGMTKQELLPVPKQTANMISRAEKLSSETACDLTQ